MKKRNYMYIGNYEIGWNATTTRDWLPLIVASILLSGGMIAILVCEVIIHLRRIS